MEEQTKELKDYLAAFRRRRGQIIAVSSVLFVVSLLAAFLWPPTYRSMATILIEEQEVPSDLIRSTVTSFATQRIQTISQTIMTRANLMQIINKYNLYADRRGRDTTEEILDGMRKDIQLNMINSDVIDPQSGRPEEATIAFTLAFEGSNPDTTQKVASELTTLYLNENLKTRTEKATETVDFLNTEAGKLNQHITEVENKIAAFKKQHANTLPDLLAVNTQLTASTERDLSDVDNQMRALDDRKFYLEGQLALLNPMSPMVGDSGDKVPDPETRLKMLRAEYVSKSAEYSPDYPDVVQLRHEIAAMEKQTGSVDSSNEQAKDLAKARADLAAARQKYSPDHPDVIRLTKLVASLEASLKKNQPATPETTVAKEQPDNPAYVTLKADLEDVNSEMQSLTAKRSELNVKLADYEKRTAQTPEVESGYLTLKRDYDDSVQEYQKIQEKQMAADVGQQLEKDRKGERFSLIDPPHLPEQPVKPNRPAIIILGLVLSMFGGFGSVAAAESIDTTVRGAHGVMAAVEAAPLSVIPYLHNNEDYRRSEKIKKRMMIGITGGIVVVILFIHFFVIPLDVLWFRGLRTVHTMIRS
ncbi:MAG: GumC family protein [Sulfuricaulis sp.]